MSWVDDPDRIRVQWRLIWLNLAAVVMNIVIGIWVWRWMTLANFASALFSAWITWGLYRRLPEIKQEQEEKIMRILRGQNG